MRIFTGYDEREALGTWVFQHSVMRHSPARHSFETVGDPDWAGTNAFTYARFEVPRMCYYAGAPALFADGADMIALADVNELNSYWQYNTAVQVVKHPEYTATSPKYLGTEMQAENKSYPRKNWSSVMLLQPGHLGWRRIRWAETDPAYWAEFGWLKDNEIGELPDEWNRLVDEGQPVEGAKILHWTLGIPAIPAYYQSPGAQLWHAERRLATAAPLLTDSQQ